MAYLMIDPCGQYPSLIMEFAARQLKQGAVAVFSSPGRYMLWRDKWSKTLGQYVVDEYLASQAPLGYLAAKIGQDHPDLTGVIPWDEESVLLGAQLGERLDLGWNPVEVIERCRDKGVMKAWLAERSDVRVNATRVVQDAGSALDFQRRVGTWPIVVKPTGGSGSQDVYFPTEDGALLGACQRVLSSGSGGVLLEEYVGGDEYAVNGIVDRDGDLLVTDVWVYDRRESHGIPNLYFESIKVSTNHPEFMRLGAYAAAVVEAMELRRSPIHMEVKVDQKGPCLIEVGARISGGNLPVLASKCYGRSLFELATCHYLGEIPASPKDIDYRAYDRYEARVLTGVQPVEIPRIRAVHGLDAVRALPSFDSFGMIRPVGTRLPVTRDLDTRSWDVYLIHSDPAQIARDAELVRQLIRYE